METTIRKIYASNTGKTTIGIDGIAKVVPDSGELLGYIVFRAETKPDSTGVERVFPLAPLHSEPITLDEAERVAQENE